MIATIAREEGFRVNAAKTRLMARGSRQRVTGIVVNAHPNIPRAEYDRLKAIIHRGDYDRDQHPGPHRLGRAPEPAPRRAKLRSSM